MNEPLVLLPLDPDPARLVTPAAPEILRLDGRTMGTHWSLQLAGNADAEAVEHLVRHQLDAAVREMSQWEPESEISRFNRADPGSWHALSPGFFHAVQAGIAMAKFTGGAFDPTLGAIVDLWGFGPSIPDELPPSDAALTAARVRSGWQLLGLDPAGRRVRQPGGLQLDLSGIGKGQAVDRVARALREAGHVSFLFEIGGEFAARGLKPDGHPWWVEVELPPGLAMPPIRLGLLDTGVATSGDYRRFFELDGERMAHSIDPRTGAPLRDAPASVTVIHPECMIADALATAITVLGPENGIALAEAADVAAIVLSGSSSDGWALHLSPRARKMADL